MSITLKKSYGIPRETVGDGDIKSDEMTGTDFSSIGWSSKGPAPASGQETPAEASGLLI